MSDDLQPIIERYRVADQDADAELAKNSVRARLFGGRTKKTRLGKYVLGKLIGVGGMGRVYMAHDRELDRKVALKLLKGSAWTGAGGEEGRLWREARTLAQINHRNVVSVYEVGEASMGVFVAMEFIDGRTLRQWINEEDPGPQEVLSALCEAGQGLVAAHAAGIIHRDLKPDNILIGKDGRVCVVDFGIAHDVATPGAPAFRREDFMTRTGRDRMLTSGPAGTPAYMAPERLEGRDAEVAGDVYGFCVSAWEALTGYLPDPYSQGPPPDPKRVVPPSVRGHLQRGLATDPAQRPATMSLLLEQLQSHGDRRQRVRVVVAGVGVLLAGLAAGALLRAPSGQASTSADPPLEVSVEKAPPAIAAPKRDIRGRTGVVLDPAAPRSSEALPGLVAVRLHVTPSAGKPGWGTAAAPVDQAIRALHKRGTDVVPIAWQGTVSARNGVDASDPASHAAHGRTMFNIAARYGHGGTHADEGEVAFVGHQIDTRGGNELSPPEYAALASAAYDGHRGALGSDVGVKAADPSIRFVMSGIGGSTFRKETWAASTSDYLDGVRAWAARNREGDFPADVIALRISLLDDHHQAAALPEDGGLYENIQRAVAWRDRHLPDRELWVSAFGYDTHPESTRRPHVDSADVLPRGRAQAQWTARGLLLMLAAGADRVALARWADAGVDPSPLQTAGLFGPPPDYAEKPSAAFVQRLLAELGTASLVGRIEGLPPHLWALQFIHPDGTHAVVLWLGTDSGAVQRAVELPFASAGAHARSLSGDALALGKGPRLVLDVSETPAVVQLP